MTFDPESPAKLAEIVGMDGHEFDTLVRLLDLAPLDAWAVCIEILKKDLPR